MRIEARRVACFPGEPVRLEVDSDTPGEVRWSGGGAPPTGAGQVFRTVFSKAGTTPPLLSVARRPPRSRSPCARARVARRGADFFGPAMDVAPVRVIGGR